MEQRHPLLCEFPELAGQLRQQQAEDPLIAHLLDDYERLVERLNRCANHESLECQALQDELEMLKDGLLQHFDLALV